MEFKVVPVRFDVKTYNKMRDAAHINNINMSDIIRYGVDLALQKGREKMLTRRDIAV